VSLKLAQRITCDEEERQRFGYKLVSSYRFPEIGGRLDRRDADVLVDGRRDASELRRRDHTLSSESGWRHQRKQSSARLPVLNLERGYWASNAEDQDDAQDAAAGRQKRRAACDGYEECARDQFEPARSIGEMASLQAALKEAIQQQFQLEPRELA
jgi:hypothetical protein